MADGAGGSGGRRQALRTRRAEASTVAQIARRGGLGGLLGVLCTVYGSGGSALYRHERRANQAAASVLRRTSQIREAPGAGAEPMRGHSHRACWRFRPGPALLGAVVLLPLGSLIPACLPRHM